MKLTPELKKLGLSYADAAIFKGRRVSTGSLALDWITGASSR